MTETLIQAKEVRSIMTKSNLPVGGYSVNPYVGCTHACKYCYASFMKRFTGHKEEWGTFLDVKHWPAPHLRQQQRLKFTEDFLQQNYNYHKKAGFGFEASFLCFYKFPPTSSSLSSTSNLQHAKPCHFVNTGAYGKIKGAKHQ